MMPNHEPTAGMEVDSEDEQDEDEIMVEELD